MVVKERCIGVDDDVVTHFGVTKSFVYRWIEEQKLPARRVGRLIRFKLSEIDNWMRQDNGQDKISRSVQDKPSSKSYTKKSIAKNTSQERSRNE